MSAEASPAATTSRTVEVPYPAPAVGWYATVILAFLYWLSVLDRYIISLLVDPIKADLGLTDVQFGMLHGLAFIGAFTLFGLVFGALADRCQPPQAHLRRRHHLVDRLPLRAVWRRISGTC